MLSRRFNVLFRVKKLCTTIFKNDFMFLASHLHRNYVAHCYCISNIPVYTVNLNTKSLRDAVNNNITEDYQIKLEKSINNNKLSKNLLISVIDNLEKDDSNISEALSLMLLHSCGRSLQKEPLEIRQELTNRIWNLLRKGKCMLTISHYHALLQTYIDNDQIIDQHKFLEDMTVRPQRDTYCLLLKVPSINPSTFADSILSRLKQDNLFADLGLYKALMYAYAADGKEEEILRIAELMKKENVRESTSLEIYLMYAYARNGNIEALTNCLMNSMPSLPLIIQLVKHLRLSKNEKHIPTVLNYTQHIQLSTVEEKDLMNFVNQLVYADCVLNAYEIITRISIDKEHENARKSLLIQFLEVLMKANKDRVTVKEIADAIKEEYSDIWSRVIESILEQKDETLAFKILNEIKAMGDILEAKHFHPLLLYVGKKYSETDVYLILKLMHRLDVQIDSETLANYVFPYIEFNDSTTTARKLCNHGVSPSIMTEPLVQHLLDKGELKGALSMCATFKKKLDCQLLLESLYLCYRKTNDIHSFIEFLFQCTSNGTGFAATILKRLLKETHTQRNIDDVEKFLIAAKQHGVFISFTDARYIQSRVFGLNLPEKLTKHILKLISDIKQQADDNCNIWIHVHPQYMNQDQLRAHIDQLRSGAQNHRGALRKLFIAACHHKHTEIINEITQEMNKYNFLWTPGMKLSLFDYYVTKEMVVEALSVLDEILKKYKDFKIDNFKIIRCAILLVKLDKIDKAYNVLQKCTSVNHKMDVHNSISELMSLLLKKTSAKYVFKVANCLVSRGYYQNMFYMFKYLILAKILEGDIKVAIDLFENCASQYKKTPGKQEILVELMKLSSTNPSMRDNCEVQVQRVCDIVEIIYGEDVVNVNLLIALILNDRMSEVQQFLKKVYIKEMLVAEQFKYLKSDQVVKCTLAILEALDNDSTMPVLYICNMALAVCDTEGEFENAIKLTKLMKEKNIKIFNCLQTTQSKLQETILSSK